MLGWIGEEVVVDSNLVASRKAGDIPAFNRGMIKLFEQSRGKARTLTAS
jgi:hypothetical protein